MESESHIILENLMKRAFPDEGERREVRKKLDLDGIYSSDELDYLNEQELLAYGFRRMQIRIYFEERAKRRS